MVKILPFVSFIAAWDTVLARYIPENSKYILDETNLHSSLHPETTPDTRRSRVIPSIPNDIPREHLPVITVDPFEPAPRGSSDVEKRFSWGWGLVDLDTTMPGDTNIALINGTPYRWRRVHISQYQMKYWHQWPRYIEPGQAITHQVWTHRGWGDVGDTAGEVTYQLEGTDTPMSFEVRYHATEGVFGFYAYVQFNGELETDTTKKGGWVQLGAKPMPGGSSFLLAGKEGSLTSSASWDNDETDKVAWMQSLLPDLGHFPLREIIMARSHHAALEDNNFAVKNIGAKKENTVTQIHPVSRQLRIDGIRVLDTRVMKYKGEFFEAHGTLISNRWYGSRGEKLATIVKQINEFNADHPGELIIWDFHRETWSSERSYSEFTTAERKEFYDLLKKVNHRAVIGTTHDGDDITSLPLADFIGNETSSVILRFDDSWKGATPKTFPGTRQGFVDGRNFPARSSWSNEYYLDGMTEDQLRKLGKHRPHRHAQLFDQQWVRTLTGFNTFHIPDMLGLIDMGRTAMVTLRQRLWNRMTDETYPNWITVDTVDGGELRGMAKAMNRCFVLRQCGNWVKRPRG